MLQHNVDMCACLHRGKRKKFLDLARRAEGEERAQQKIFDANTRAEKYSDRNRYRCIGTPLMNSDDRHIMSTRSTLRPTTNEIRNKIGTPVTEVYHPQEAWGRSETILKRHMSNKLAWNNGQERKWNRQHRRTSVGDMSARRCDVTGYGSQVFVEFRKDHPLPVSFQSFPEPFAARSRCVTQESVEPRRRAEACGCVAAGGDRAGRRAGTEGASESGW